METITNTDNTISEKIVDFMDKRPGLIPFIITLVIVTGFFFMG